MCDCIFFSEYRDMGATVPLCIYKDTLGWDACVKENRHKNSLSWDAYVQENCPHYISIDSVRDHFRKKFKEEEKWTLYSTR